jgi:protein-S-isoprenylcysteine O-methyltransferase Ste14
MYYVACGAFLLFLIGDLNDIRFHNKTLKLCFAAGCVLLIASTASLVMKSGSAPEFPILIRIVFGIFALLFFDLLVYTLFFALPFEKTYVDADSKNSVCDSGVYALCRHPGVIWFFFLYISLWISVGIPLYAALTFSLLNLAYAAVQDRFIFPALLYGYDQYKARTPFLLPNAASVKRCLSYYMKTEVQK